MPTSGIIDQCAGKKPKQQVPSGARRLRRTIIMTHPDGTKSTREIIFTNKEEVCLASKQVHVSDRTALANSVCSSLAVAHGLLPHGFCFHSSWAHSGAFPAGIITLCRYSNQSIGRLVHVQISLLNSISGREPAGGFGTHTIKGRRPVSTAEKAPATVSPPSKALLSPTIQMHVQTRAACQICMCCLMLHIRLKVMLSEARSHLECLYTTPKDSCDLICWPPIIEM